MARSKTLRVADDTDEYLAWLSEQVPQRFKQERLGPDPNGHYSRPVCATKGCARVATGVDGARCRLCLRGGPRPLQGRSKGGDAARGIFRFDLISNPVVRLEMQYALSLRADPNSGGQVRAEAANVLFAALQAQRVSSVLALRDNTKATERLKRAVGSYWVQARAILWQTQEGLLAARGDTTAKVILGRRRGGSRRWSKAQEIPQPWLRELVQRWVQYRLDTEAAAAQHVGQQESMLVTFAIWCDQQTPAVRRPADVDRALLLAWLSHVKKMTNDKGEPLDPTYANKFLAAVEQFIEVARVDFGAKFSPTAQYLRGERLNAEAPNPRYLDGPVIATLRKEENLALIPDEDVRLVVAIMMHVGMRAGHVCALEFDCLRELGQDGTSWALSYYDGKSGRWIGLPVDDYIAQAIRRQQRRVRDSARAGKPVHLFPNPRARITGVLAPEKIGPAVDNWVEELDLRGPDGLLLKVTPHRFRHTFAVEMLERGVPIDVIRDLLGHKSLSSTEIYAHTTDRRLREEWEKGKAVNIRGESVDLVTGAEGDAEWLLHRLNTAVQPLADGYCGLPIQQRCPHANACHTCMNFLTTPEFLPALKRQLNEHDRFISEAEKKGYLRIVEINAAPREGLRKIIDALESEVST